MLTRELEDDDDALTTEKIWPGDEVKHDHFCSLKANSLKTGTKHLNDRLCLLVR